MAEFDQDRYRTGETMSIRFQVVNHLPEAVRGIKVGGYYFEPDAISVDYESWGRLNNGVDIAGGGGSYTVTLTGRVGRPGATTGVLAGYFYDPTGASIAEFHHAVPVDPTFGRAGGIVYADENDNARFDPGEGLAGVEVTAQNQVDFTDSATVATGADGSFTFPRLPTVRFMLSTTPPDGWLVGYHFVTIETSNANDSIRLRGVRPLTDLTASLAFTQDSYRVGELAKVRVTLANRGARDVVGIVANCNRAGNSNALTGTTQGWGAFAGDGVTVPAHRTVDLTVTEPVPKAGFSYGKVTVACDFSYRYVEDAHNPEARDAALVPGGVGVIEGVVGHFADGYGKPPVGVGNARLVLATDARCPILAETRAGADGRFRFATVPAGEHELYVVPPKGWRVRYENPSAVSVMANRTSELVPEVTPGAADPPALPRQPAECGEKPDTEPHPRPNPHGRTATGLADTGADVAGLFLAGLGTAAAGMVGVVVSRRRGRRKVTTGSR